MLNWIVLKIGQIELNCVLMLNWIVWNRTVYTYKKRFGIKSPTMIDMSWNQTKPKQTKPNQTIQIFLNSSKKVHSWLQIDIQ